MNLMATKSTGNSKPARRMNFHGAKACPEYPLGLTGFFALFVARWMGGISHA